MQLVLSHHSSALHCIHGLVLHTAILWLEVPRGHRNADLYKSYFLPVPKTYCVFLICLMSVSAWYCAHMYLEIQ